MSGADWLGARPHGSQLPFGSGGPGIGAQSSERGDSPLELDLGFGERAGAAQTLSVGEAHPGDIEGPLVDRGKVQRFLEQCGSILVRGCQAGGPSRQDRQSG